MATTSPHRHLTLLLLLLLIVLGFRRASPVPLRPKDVLRTAVDLLPSFVAAVTLSEATTAVAWRGACFADNNATLKLTANGGILRLKTASAQSWTCMDLYVFATPYRITWDHFFAAREHTLKIDSWAEQAELDYVKRHGVSVFLMPHGVLGTLLTLVDAMPLFANTVRGQNANLALLKKHMGASFEKRSQPWHTDIRKEDVHSGDFLAISKIRGQWGGFQTLQKWVTGAFAGHTAVCLKDEMGSLWVAESGHETAKGEEIIGITPWDEWWELARKDECNPHVALLPLHPDVRARFNATAAWAYARSMFGMPYGYHNMIFSWIDTAADNYPPPLDAHLLMTIMSIWTRLQPVYAANLWNEALNKRLGTQDLEFHEIIAEIEQRGMSFAQLLAIPERDEWVYSDGKSTTCVAFILEMYKEAGVFAPLCGPIQVTEFTIRDAYMLKIFEDNQTRLPSWCKSEAEKLPFCQILGEYRMELPEYNTIEPYANMNENCPSLPPSYKRPARC